MFALGACSGDGGSGRQSAAPGASATAGADTGGGPGRSGTSGAHSGALEGNWLTTSKGKAVALVVTGEKAGLFATGGTMCGGTVRAEGGMRRIRLTCTDGGKERTTGMVDSVNGTSLKVTWEGPLGTETYTRAEGGTLPSGLPTAHLGS
ncbi:hypothetical protein GCM10027072_34810 [Streptomyces bullii]